MSLLLLAVVGGVAQADEGPVQASVHGDAKSFFFASFPYDHLLFVDDPTDPTALTDPQAEPSGQGLVSGRLALEAAGWDRVKLDLHGILIAGAPGGGAGGGGFLQTGAGTPQAVDLTWEAVSGAGLDAFGRVDRATLSVALDGVDLTLGRQPVTLGRALIFTPWDLGGPISPTVVDQDYNPGGDAARVDAYVGMATQFTAIAAYGAPEPGDWAPGGLVVVGTGQTTVGVWDLGLMGGSVHGDTVFGGSLAGVVGPVGLHLEGTVTLPAEGAGPDGADEDPFARVVAGAMHSFGDLTLSGEAYYQGNGAAEPGAYLVQATSERYARAELWAWGQWYGAASASWQAFPRLGGTLAVIANLADPSALVAPSLSWSVSGESDLSLGAYVGLGARPDDVTLQTLVDAGLGPGSTEADVLRALPVNSEYGLIPATAFASWRAYF